jgi:hypothetical protein
MERAFWVEQAGKVVSLRVFSDYYQRRLNPRTSLVDVISRGFCTGNGREADGGENEDRDAAKRHLGRWIQPRTKTTHRNVLEGQWGCYVDVDEMANHLRPGLVGSKNRVCLVPNTALSSRTTRAHVLTRWACLCLCVCCALVAFSHQFLPLTVRERVPNTRRIRLPHAPSQSSSTAIEIPLRFPRCRVDYFMVMAKCPSLWGGGVLR